MKEKSENFTQSTTTVLCRFFLFFFTHAMSQQHILTANVVAVAQRAHDAKLDVGTPLTVIADDQKI